MKRKIYNKLLMWKDSHSRKPLIIQGARQVGKTYIVNMFAKEQYSNYVYCNFEKETDIKDFFTSLNPKSILQKMSYYKRKEIIPGNTLLIFDEIQACPEALTSLKYFQEEANEYHIIALGSLLGVSVNRGNMSFPVGKVEFLNMYPMDFEEFLLSKKEEYLVEMIKTSYQNDSKLDTIFHNRALEYYKEYLFVGGMPEAILEYNNHNNPDIVRIKQNDILSAYHNDMGKYNKQTEIPKTRIVYKNISVQLAKENKKFQYKYLKSGGRASEFENAIEWLCLSGIASQLFRIENIMLPLNAYKSLDDFKFYMSDVGLCLASQNLDFQDIVRENTLLDNFKGGLTENYVFNQLQNNGLELYYWTSGNQAEVDFITRINGEIIPIEVKASENTRSKSLNIFKTRYNNPYAIRLSMKNFGFENGIKSVPLYATFCIMNSKDS